MTKPKTRRVPPKKRTQKKLPHKRVVKRTKVADSCGTFACQKPAKIAGFCVSHPLTENDVQFRRMMYDAAWMVKHIPQLKVICKHNVKA